MLGESTFWKPVFELACHIQARLPPSCLIMTQVIIRLRTHFGRVNKDRRARQPVRSQGGEPQLARDGLWRSEQDVSRVPLVPDDSIEIKITASISAYLNEAGYRRIETTLTRLSPILCLEGGARGCGSIFPAMFVLWGWKGWRTGPSDSS